MLFKLRSHIELTYRKDWKVYALWNKGQIDLPPQFMGGNSFVDPRTSQLGIPMVFFLKPLQIIIYYL